MIVIVISIITITLPLMILQSIISYSHHRSNFPSFQDHTFAVAMLDVSQIHASEKKLIYDTQGATYTMADT